MIDKSKREDGTFSREDFTFDKERDVYICPAGKILTTTGRVVNDDQLLYRASKLDCDVCRFKMQCCLKNQRARSRAAYMNTLAILLVRSAKRRRSSDRVATESAWKCCLRT